MAYRDAVLAETSLVAYWELQETSGTAAADSKSTHTGTFSGTYTLGSPSAPGAGPLGAMWLNTGVQSVALALAGNGYVTIPAFAVASGGAISVEAWVYPTVSGQNGSVIWKNPVNAEWGLFIEGGVLKWRGNSSAATLNGPTLTLNAWSHVVATQTGTTATLYVNGSQAATGTVTAIADDTTAGTNDLNIGRFNSNYYLTGKIEQVALYNAVLTATQVSNHYTASTQYKPSLGVVTQEQAEAVTVSTGASTGAARVGQAKAEVVVVSAGASVGAAHVTEVVAEAVVNTAAASGGAAHVTQVVVEIVLGARRRRPYTSVLG